MTSMSDNAEQDVIKALPPQDMEKCLFAISTLVPPDYSEEILRNFIRPLEIEFDVAAKRFFIASDYNRVGDSFRSPWSNCYYPPLAKSAEDDNHHEQASLYPPEHLRALEIEWNRCIELYRNAYYDGGLSSVYVWESHDDSIFGAFMIHNDLEGATDLKKACWDVVHVAEIRTQKGSVFYRVTSSLLISLEVANEDVGVVDVGTSMTKQHEQQRKLSTVESVRQISTVGSMIEELENMMRRSLEAIYIGKLREVLHSLRFMTPESPNLKTFTSFLGSSTMPQEPRNLAATMRRISKLGYDGETEARSDFINIVNELKHRQSQPTISYGIEEV